MLAELYRQQAEDFDALSESTDDPMLKDHYKALAQAYRDLAAYLDIEDLGGTGGGDTKN